ncbi:hypothetical protein Ahy_B01g052654 [Arachis hypogaea]|uniref:Uncharacterized protein n=1 Tax=Arachis hypogaea TaxID=3818 RepID=A0A445APZ7_ARAHY|nr:hypothetical protein Ahy_B01g052654 [Arachis hypogaea]
MKQDYTKLHSQKLYCGGMFAEDPDWGINITSQLSWPLSTREAIVHDYLFEYYQDDLVVVLLNSVSDSKSITGFNSDVIPDAKDAVRSDVVGGFALQKVTPERSYFWYVCCVYLSGCVRVNNSRKSVCERTIGVRCFHLGGKGARGLDD